MPKKAGLSFVVLMALFVIIVILRFVYPPDNALTWDVFGYYLYLPSKFIYHDLDLVNQAWLNEIIQKYHTTETLYQAYIAPNGQWVIKYSMGMAVMYMPFFFMSGLVAKISGFPVDGFSMPYQYGLSIGGLVYTIIGLYFFRKILLKYFNDKTTSLLLILTVLGTNYIHQATGGNLAPHNFLFSLFAAAVWFAIKWHETPKKRYMVLMGLTMGMIMLVRPNEGVCLLVPVFWGVYDRKSLFDKFKLINEHKIQIVLGIICFVIVLLPQFYYWKRQTGSYIFYSYLNPNEGFDWLRPHIGNFLLSFRKGWLIYTPLAILSILGLIPLYKKRKDLFFPVIIYFIVSLYIVSSWSCWWYAGGCYSQRAIVSSYVLLALPLGFLIEWINSLNSFKKVLLYLIFTFLLLLNLFQYWQFYNGILKGYNMTGKYYGAIFGKTRIPEGAESLLLVNRGFNMNETMPNPNQFSKTFLGYFDFSHVNPSEPANLVKDIKDTSSYCLMMDSVSMYSPGVYVKYKNITGEYYAWIKVRIRFLLPEAYNEPNPLIVVTFLHEKLCYQYFTKELKYEDGKKGLWQDFSVDYLTPEVRDIEDTLQAYIWHRGKSPVYIKNLIIEAYHPVGP